MPILMMGEERFAVAVADAFSRVTVRQADRRLHRHGQPERRRHPDGVRRHRPGLGGFLAAAGASPKALSRGASRHTHYDMAGAFKSVTKWVGEIDRAELVPDYVRRAFTHLRSGRPGPVLLIVPRDLGEYDADEHPYTPVKGWRSGPDPDDVRSAVKALLAAKDPLLLRGRGRALRRRHRRAAAVRRAGPGAGADHAEGQERLPREPSAVGGRARLARRALPEQVRRALLDRLQPVPQPLQPLDPRRRQEDDRPVHGRHARHQPQLRDAPRGDRRRQADAAGADRRAGARAAPRKRPEVLDEIRAGPARRSWRSSGRGWSPTRRRSIRTASSATS